MKTTNVAEIKERNLMIHGLNEEDGEDLKAKVATVLGHLDDKPVFSIPSRIGVATTGNIRPVRVTLPSQDNVMQFLRNAKKLKDKEECSRVFLSPDRTRSREERDQRR